MTSLSTTVNRYLLPQVAAGRGPTMSTWMWVNRLAGMAMGWTAAVCCLEALALTLLAVLDPCGHVAVEAAPHHPGGYEPLGGPHTSVG